MYKEICDYLSRDIYPFHMPGHKGNAAFFPPNMHRLDITEIPGMDNLANLEGIIKNFCERIADFYGAAKSFFLTNGSSAGIVAVICAACEGVRADIYIPRNAHVSVYNALVLSGARPKYFFSPEIEATPKNHAEPIFRGRLNLSRNATFLLVSPTYEGRTENIAEIAKQVHARDGLLIVDEAHGAHFAFHDYFPQSALSQGADIVINSLHKTLPAPSACAVLHCSRRALTRIDPARLRFFLNAMQTTSPSYMQMAICDFVLNKLWQNPDLFEAYVQRLKNIRGALNFSEGLDIAERSNFPKEANRYDPSKLLFSRKSSSHTPLDYKIQFEMETPALLLAMTSVADTDEGFSRLITAAQGLELTPATPWENFHHGNTQLYPRAKSSPSLPASSPKPTPTSPPAPPECILTPREAMQRPHEIVSAEAAVGRICAQLIADYPPGIAILAPGELICEKPPRSHICVVK